MAMDISKATIGYDIQGVSVALGNIRSKVINEAKNQMDTSFAKLEEAVDACWKGQSADTFKKNMSFDKESVKQGLEDSYQALNDELFTIGKAVDKIDQELVTERKR